MDDSSTYNCRSSDNTKLFGYIWPCKAPRAVMSLVHGFGEHSGRYAHMAANLNANGIAVIAIDLRGHGRSDGPRGVVKKYDDFRADIEALLAKTRSLYPNLPHILYGHSMGGGVVMDYGFAKDEDINAIIASAPLIKLAQPPPSILTPIVKLLRFFRPKGAIKQPIDGTKISTLKIEQSLYLEDEFNHGQCGFGTALGMVKTGDDIAARAAQWNAPLLLIHSRDDVLTDFSASEAFAQTANNVEFHSFDNSAHELHNDIHRVKIYALMSDFIDRHIS
ncbi:MAG: lysophospholipase [Litorimonas sp.]